MEVLNKVKNLKTTDAKTFLSWEFNTLKDSKRDVTKLKTAIRKSGWSFPVIVWNNFVIDGAGRKKAVEEMIKEGDTIPEIPYVEIEAKNLQDAKSKALEVSSQFGEITRDSFLSFTEDLELDFDTFEIDGMSADAFIESDEKDDEVPETPTEPKSKLGDLYELGGHRVLCGDSTKIEDVERLMDGKKADMVFTDPPYGVDYSGGIQFTKSGVKKEQRERLLDDQLGTDIYKEVVPILSSFCNGAIYLWFSDTHALPVYQAVEEVGDIHALIIWEKNGGYGAMNANYKQKHEPCLYWKPKGKKLDFCGATTETTIWKIDKDGKNKLHPTQKPVELSLKAIKNHSVGLIMDLFLGSGATMIACEKLNRSCYGMELDPKYIDVIIQRYVDYVDSPKVIKNGIDETHLWKKKTK